MLKISRKNFSLVRIELGRKGQLKDIWKELI